MQFPLQFFALNTHLHRTFICAVFAIFIANSGRCETNQTIYYRIDSEEKLKIDDFLQNNIETKEYAGTDLNLGFVQSTVWVVCPFTKIPQDLVFVFANNLLDSVDAFCVRDGKVIQHEIYGDNLLYEKRFADFPVINGRINNASDKIIFRLKSTGPMVASFRLMTITEFINFYIKVYIIHFIYFGVLLLALTFNLFFYIRIRESNYLYYAIGVTGFLLAMLYDNGYLFEFVWPNHPELNEPGKALYLSTVFIVLFAERFLKIRENFPNLYKCFLGIYIAHAILLAIFATGDSFLALYLYSIIWLIVPIFLFSVTLYNLYKRKNSEIKFLLAAWTFLLCSIVTYILAVHQFLPYNVFTANVIPIGSTIEVILICLAVVNRVEFLKKEKEKLLSDQNKILEEKLSERTAELVIKNQLIEERNQELEISKNFLKEKVDQQTKDLKEAYIDLEEKNKRLEQFVYIAAHNLRGPVATLKGLYNVLNMMNPSDLQNSYVLDQFGVTADKLDEIIKELSLLLDFKKDLNSLIQEINLEELMESTKMLLHQDIKEFYPEINFNNNIQSEFRSVPIYLNSILFNLLSNAIRFRKSDKNCRIDVTCTECDSFVSISVKDNGEGLDIKTYENKIFLPYQRFHPGKSGRGLGLFITKTQVDILKGKICAESIIGEGSSFTVKIPKLLSLNN